MKHLPQQGVILVVDDDEDILSALVYALEDEGYQTKGVQDANAAWKYLEAEAPPALVLLDYMLPLVSGADFAKKVKAHEKFQSIPVVISSAAGAPAAKLGESIDGFLAKPIHLDALFALVDRFVKK